jgi:hypothetical protein
MGGVLFLCQYHLQEDAALFWTGLLPVAAQIGQWRQLPLFDKARRFCCRTDAGIPPNLSVASNIGAIPFEPSYAVARSPVLFFKVVMTTLKFI